MPVWKETLPANKARRVMNVNSNRACFTVKNDSATDVFVGHNMRVATSGYNQGAKIGATGGSVEDAFHRGEVWLITTAAVDVTCIEDVKIVDD